VSANNPEQQARRLLQHRLERRANVLGSGNHAPASLEAAYLIQDTADAILRAEHGFRRIGYKIAGTNPASRAHLKIDAPFFGRLYAQQAAPSPARLPFVPDFYRVHEPEIAVEIGRDLDPGQAPFDASQIEAATRAVRPAIEIIGTHFTPWTEAGAPNLASDNAAFGYWIRGAPVADWSGLDLLDAEISISINGTVVGTGQERNVDGGAFGASAWLANALAARGHALRAGDMITTGSVTRPVPVEAGQEVVANFGDLGRVVVTLD